MAETPLRYAGQEVLTLRQIDRLNGVAKGTGFRAFKRVRDELTEGRDFFRLDASEHASYIEALRRAGLVYESTIHCVLLTRAAYRRMGVNSSA
jgi:N-acetyl-beta-hexosaminidase